MYVCHHPRRNLEDRKQKLLDAEEKRRKAILEDRRREQSKAQTLFKHSTTKLKQKPSSTDSRHIAGSRGKTVKSRQLEGINGVKTKPSLSLASLGGDPRTAFNINSLAEMVSGTQPLVVPSLDEMLDRLRSSGPIEDTHHTSSGKSPLPVDQEGGMSGSVEGQTNKETSNSPPTATRSPTPTIYSTTNYCNKANNNTDPDTSPESHDEPWADRVSELPLYDSLESSPSTSAVHLSEPVLDISREFDKAASGFNRTSSEHYLLPRSHQPGSPSSSDSAKQLTSILKKSGQKAQLKQLLSEAIEASSHSGSQPSLRFDKSQRAGRTRMFGETQKRVRFAEESTVEAPGTVHKDSPPPGGDKRHFMFPASKEVLLRVSPHDTHLRLLSKGTHLGQNKPEPTLGVTRSLGVATGGPNQNSSAASGPPRTPHPVQTNGEHTSQVSTNLLGPLPHQVCGQETTHTLSTSTDLPMDPEDNDSPPQSSSPTPESSLNETIEDEDVPMSPVEGRGGNPMEKTPTDDEIAKLWSQMKTYMEENRALQESRRAGLQRLQDQPGARRGVRTHPSHTGKNDRTYPSDTRRNSSKPPPEGRMVHGPPLAVNRRDRKTQHSDLKTQHSDHKTQHLDLKTQHSDHKRSGISTVTRLADSATTQCHPASQHSQKRSSAGPHTRRAVRLWRSSRGWRDEVGSTGRDEEKTNNSKMASTHDYQVDYVESLQEPVPRSSDDNGEQMYTSTEAQAH